MEMINIDLADLAAAQQWHQAALAMGDLCWTALSP